VSRSAYSLPALSWKGGCSCDQAYLGRHDQPTCPGVGQPIYQSRMVGPVSWVDLQGLLITAVEGGIGYWAQVRAYRPDAGTVEVRDAEEQGARWRRVTVQTLLRGLDVCAKEYPRITATWLQDRIGDAGIADSILQAGLFGDLVYG
jgi:hypothetical protein